MVLLDSQLEQSNQPSRGLMAIFREATELISSGEYEFLIEQLVQLLESSDDRSYIALAKDLLPDLHNSNPEVAKKIIHLQMNKAIEIYSAKYGLNANTVSENRESLVKSAANKRRNSSAPMLDAMERTVYSDQEIEFLINLANHSIFEWNKPGLEGKPNCRLIAVILNSRFGNNRSPRSVYEILRRLNQSEDPRLNVTKGDSLYSAVGESPNHYLDNFILKIILERNLYETLGNAIAQIVTNVTDLRSYQEIAKDLIPDEYERSVKAAEQIILTIIDFLRNDTTIEFNVDLFEARQYLLHGNRSRQTSNVENILSDDIVRYTHEEIVCIVHAMRSPNALWITANNKTKVDYSAVATMVNEQIHDCTEVRTAEKISNIIRWYRTKRKKMMKKFYMFVESNPEYFPDIDNPETPAEAIANFYFYNMEAFLFNNLDEQES